MKKLFITLTFLLLVPVIVFADNETNLLYDTIKNEVSGGYSKEYSGDHIDKPDGTGNEKIYYWYGPDDDSVDYIDTKRNVLFGGFCWQTVRTTDSGGTKLIYNGEPVDGKCLDNRTSIIVDDGISSTALSRPGSSYFADSIEYNQQTGKYRIVGNLFLSEISEETKDAITNKYTYLSDNPDTENTYKPYKVLEYLDEGYFMSSTSGSNFLVPYNAISASSYHTTYSRDGLSGAGYMFNTTKRYRNYSFTKANIPKYSQEGPTINIADMTVLQNDGNHTYSKDPNSEKWVMTRYPYNDTSTFKFKPNIEGNIILSYDYKGSSSSPLKIYKNSELFSEIIYSGQGTLLIDNLGLNDEITIVSSFYSRSYYFDFSVIHGTGEVTDNRYVFGKDVTYQNGVYTLVDINKWDGNRSIGNYHYYCQRNNTTCEKVIFMYYIYDSGSYFSFHAYELENGEKIDDFVNRQLYADDVNKHNTPVKYTIDLWYEENLIGYQNNLEDVVFCNDRRTYYNNLDKDKPYEGSLVFHPSRDTYYNNQEYYDSVTEYNSNLGCYLPTDKFSLNNSKAKLKYPIALLTMPEAFLINVYEGYGVPRTKAVIDTVPGSYINLMTPNGVGSRWVVTERGVVRSFDNGNGGTIRPVISLKKGTKYINGSGTQDDPFVIPITYKINIQNNSFNGTIDSDISFDNVGENDRVVFRVNAKRGFILNRVEVTDSDDNNVDLEEKNETYSFIMPNKDVTIKTSYSINVPDTIKNISFILLSFVMIMICLGILRVTLNIKEKE